MRNDLPTISESAEELARQLESSTKKRSKQRLRALYLIQSGECATREAVASTLGVHRHTVSRWLAKYEEGGISEMLQIRTRPNRKRVVPDEIYENLKVELRDSPEQFSSYRDVQAWLKSRFGLDVKYKTLYRLIRYELGVDLAKAGNAGDVAKASVVGRAAAESSDTRSDAVNVLTPSTSIAAAVEDHIAADIGSESGSIKTAPKEIETAPKQIETAAKQVEKVDADDTNPVDPIQVDRRPATIPEFERSTPSVANFFRSVASLLDDESIVSTDVLQAVRAANAILNSAPPMGFFDESAETYLPGKGRKMLHRRKKARRTLRNLQSSVNKEDITPEQTRAILNQLADEFDAVAFGTSDSSEVSVHIKARTNRVVIGEPMQDSLEEPHSMFLDDSANDSFSEADNSDDVAQGQSSVRSSGGLQDSSVDTHPEYIVLFAEEDDITASIVKRQLGKESTSVIRANSSEEVFAALAKYPVDLMVINTRLHEEDGLQLLRQLRDEPSFDNIPIVAVGWPEDVNNEAEVLRYGADDYMTKPFVPKEFTAKVVKLLIASRAAVQKRDDRAPIKIARLQPGQSRRDRDAMK